MSTTDESEFPRHARVLRGRLRAMSNPVQRAQTPVLAADPALWTEDIEALMLRTANDATTAAKDYDFTEEHARRWYRAVAAFTAVVMAFVWVKQTFEVALATAPLGVQVGLILIGFVDNVLLALASSWNLTKRAADARSTAESLRGVARRVEIELALPVSGRTHAPSFVTDACDEYASILAAAPPRRRARVHATPQVVVIQAEGSAGQMNALSIGVNARLSRVEIKRALQGVGGLN